jgi:hypothetical protein
MANGAVSDSPASITTPPALPNGVAFHPSDRWLPVPRRDHNGWAARNGSANGNGRHNRQKSLTDAFRTIRARNGSVSQNAHEIADALRAPVSPKLIVSNGSTSLCLSSPLHRRSRDSPLKSLDPYSTSGCVDALPTDRALPQPSALLACLFASFDCFMHKTLGTRPIANAVLRRSCACCGTPRPPSPTLPPSLS